MKPYGENFLPMIEMLSKDPNLVVVETDEAKELLNVLRKTPYALILGCVTHPQQAMHLSHIARILAPQVKDGSIRFLITTKLKDMKISSAIQKSGITEYNNDPVPIKSFEFKLKRNLDTLKQKKSRADALKQQKTTSQTTGESSGKSQPTQTQTARGEVKFAEPLTTPSDFWLLKGGNAKLIVGRWVVNMTGPGPMAGRWVELEDRPQHWKFVLTERFAKKFEVEKGSWIAIGNRPDFRGGLWAFVGKKTELHFKPENGELQKKICADASNNLIVAKDSHQALRLLPVIQETLVSEINIGFGENESEEAENKIKSGSSGSTSETEDKEERDSSSFDFSEIEESSQKKDSKKPTNDVDSAELAKNKSEDQEKSQEDFISTSEKRDSSPLSVDSKREQLSNLKGKLNQAETNSTQGSETKSPEREDIQDFVQPEINRKKQLEDTSTESISPDARAQNEKNETTTEATSEKGTRGRAKNEIENSSESSNPASKHKNTESTSEPFEETKQKRQLGSREDNTSQSKTKSTNETEPEWNDQIKPGDEKPRDWNNEVTPENDQEKAKTKFFDREKEKANKDHQDAVEAAPDAKDFRDTSEAEPPAKNSKEKKESKPGHPTLEALRKKLKEKVPPELRDKVDEVADRAKKFGMDPARKGFDKPMSKYPLRTASPIAFAFIVSELMMQQELTLPQVGEKFIEKFRSVFKNATEIEILFKHGDEWRSVAGKTTLPSDGRVGMFFQAKGDREVVSGKHVLLPVFGTSGFVLIGWSERVHDDFKNLLAIAKTISGIILEVEAEANLSKAA